MSKVMDQVKLRVSKSLSSLSNMMRRGGSNAAGAMNFGYQRSESMDIAQLSVPTLRQLSVPEAMPSIDAYRNPMSQKRTNRPSLRELHQEKPKVVIATVSTDEQHLVENGDVKKPGAPSGQVKFGWIVGVFVRCVLNILGAMLYLRLSWVAGQAGIGLATVIICLSALVTTLTALSMCAICTNGEIKGGGSYYMVSRGLGPEFGGSMGLIFALANALGVGMHIVGFAETVRDIMREQETLIVDGATNDVRIIGICTLVLCFCIVLMGVDFEVKAQLVLLVVLTVSYINYIVGTFIPPPLWKQARGLTGYTWSTFSANFVPGWRGEGFFSVFSVFFPAATGIMAGANISGDLKDPGVAIPKGTLLAILVTTVTYLGGAWMSASCAVRDASGDVGDVLNGTLQSCMNNGTCRYGIMNFFQTMEMQSGFGPLITAGIFAATLSSALACLVSGPKLLQAVGRDKLFPRLDWFAKGFGTQDEPRRAYVLCFFISCGMVLVGDLNIIASYISNFYLATYGLINYACFDGSIAKSPGWRPSFKYYNKWTALLGAALCVACMFLMSWIAALITYVFIIALYIYLLRSQPDVNWGSSMQAHSYRVALKSALKLLHTEEHVKNYRPQILAMTGNPVTRPAMIDFVKCITGRISLLMFGHVVVCRPDSDYYKTTKVWTDQIYNWLRLRKIKGFYNPVASSSLKSGIRSLLQASGVGKMKPNVVIVGFKTDWKKSTAQDIDDYFQMIHEAFECGVGVGVVKVANGFDYSNDLVEFFMDGSRKQSRAMRSRLSGANLAGNGVFETNLSSIKEESDTYFSNEKQRSPVSDTSGSPPPTFDDFQVINSSTSVDENMDEKGDVLTSFRVRAMNEVRPEILLRMNQFRHKVKKPVIDIYWLSDDGGCPSMQFGCWKSGDNFLTLQYGGLTILVPYLLTHHRSYLADAKLRVFSSSSPTANIEQEQQNLNALLAKFRIQTADVKIIRDLRKTPQSSTIAEFERLITPFMLENMETKSADIDSSVTITENELTTMQERTYMHLRTRELLLEHSKNASLIIITLPVPRKGAVSACLYLAWLDFMCKDFSPVLFIRGNQQSVLTFYS